MPELSKKLKTFKSKDNRENRELFHEICDDVGKIFESGSTGEFGKISGRPLPAETALSKKLFWLRTLPLEDKNSFTALHSESNFCVPGKKRNCSAGILGIWRSPESLELASLEVRTGKRGAHLLYAAAEGLRNLASAWHDIGEQAKLWKESYQAEWDGPWRKTDPFRDLSKKQARLIIIGGPEWIKENAQSYLNLIPDTIKIGKLHAEASIYSVNTENKAKTPPVSIIPLRKIHPLKKHILDIMADIYSDRY
jgi:hypothetical protein